MSDDTQRGIPDEPTPEESTSVLPEPEVPDELPVEPEASVPPAPEVAPEPAMVPQAPEPTVPEAPAPPPVAPEAPVPEATPPAAAPVPEAPPAVQQPTYAPPAPPPPPGAYAGQQPYAPPAPAPACPKSKVAAGVLGILLGSLGIHKFYLGYTTEGIIMLAVSVVGGIITFGLASAVVSVIGLVEGIIYLTKTDDEFCDMYVYNKKGWF